MPAPAVAIIIGSLRKDSFNRQLAGAVQRLAGERFAFRVLEIGDLPLYNQDFDSLPRQPEQYVRFRDQIRPVDGVLFVSPEYNRGIPGVLKNAIDVGSRPYGHSVWNGKPTAIVTASPGAIGGFGSNHQIRQACVFLNMPVMAQPEAYLGHVNDQSFDESGCLKEGPLKELVVKLAHSFHDWVDMIHRSRALLAKQAEMTEERPEPAKA